MARPLSRAARLILVGAPGVGKGTQSARLLSRFPQLSAISSGDLLRDNVRARTALGIQVQRLMKSGALVPDALILRLILAEFTNRGWLRDANLRPYTLNASASSDEAPVIPVPEEELDLSNADYVFNDSPTSSFILDGFPRTAGQAAQLDPLVPINMVVHLDTPADIVLERIANRWVHAPSGRVYNTTFNPPRSPGKDDVTGEALTKREDDSEDVWKARLQKFEETSAPLLEHYDRLGLLWKVKGNSSDEISPQLFTEFEKRFGEGAMSAA